MSNEPDWDDVRDQVAASIRAEILILAHTPGITAADIVRAAIRDVKTWAQDGINVYRKRNTQ